MRTLILATVFAVLSLLTPAFFAQTEHPGVSQDQVVEKAKPFLGDWNSVVCDSRRPQPYGVRFNIYLRPDDDKSVEPVFRLLGVQGYVMDPFDFQTLDFTEIVGDTPDKHFIWIDVTNSSLVLTLQPSKTGLNGVVTETRDDFQSSLFAERGDDAKDPYAYVTILAKSCPTSKPEQKSNKAQVALR